MKQGIISVLFLSIACIVFGETMLSCTSKKTEDHSSEHAAELYEQSAKLLETYIDSMKMAKDSTVVNNLKANYEKRITKLNFDYEPDVYLKMTADQNDTLIKLTERFIELGAEKLKRFGSKEELTNDSTQSGDALRDSITQKS